MKIRKLGLVSALIFGLSAGNAVAADMFDRDYRGSVKDDGYSYEGAPERGWYLRGDVGYGFNSNPDADDSIAKFVGEDLDDTWTIGGGVGYHLMRGIRVDLTLDYRFESDLYAFFPASPTTPLTGELSSLVGLANFYYDFDLGHRITPYVGVGIGFARHTMDAGKLVSGADVADFNGKTETEFAWAIMAGVDVDLRDRWKLDIGYRYLNMGDASYLDAETGTKTFNINDLESHEIRVGVRYSFSCWRSCEPSYEPMK